MRCDNCGWNNPDNVTKCQKCNQELIIASSEQICEATPQVSPSPSAPSPSVLNATVRDFPAHGSYDQGPSAPSPSAPPSSSIKATVRDFPAHGSYDQGPSAPSPSAPPSSSIKATVRDFPAHGSQNIDTNNPDLYNHEAPSPSSQDGACPNCGYPVLPRTSYCPSCGTALNGNKEQIAKSAQKQTEAVPYFRLVPMDNFDGKCSNEILLSPGSELHSKDVFGSEQRYFADIDINVECQDGVWTVQSKGSRNQVYVSTSNPVRIERGDVIIIGNRRYIFE